MDWDIEAFGERVRQAVASFDRPATEDLCRELELHLFDRKTPYPVPAARRILQLLRSKRYFDLLGKAADLFIQSGQNAPLVRRQYAQALLDLGQLSAGLDVLERLVAETREQPEENAEAVGLVGRAHKQLFVNARQDQSAWSRRHLQQAIGAYLSAYSSDPKKNLWHGINVVALVARAERGDLPRPVGAPDARSLAAEILAQLETRRDATGLTAWDYATAAEACLALGKPAEEALAWLVPYVQNPGADAFELGSTLRQFIEVWQLEDGAGLGAQILPVLRAELLRREGGATELSPRDLTRAAVLPPGGQVQLEKIFGPDGIQTLKWFRTGLDRCENVAQVQDPNDTAWGTGLLLRGGDLKESLAEETFLLTNAHVVADSEAEGALPAVRARAVFHGREAAGSGVGAHRLQQIWSSPRADLDATLLRLLPPARLEKPCPIAERLPSKGPPPQRVYVIGHPGGRGLSISLQDNLLLDYGGRLIHYRAPTEQGSSGSPVFNADWEVIGLHHGGSEKARRLVGTGVYAANEGIWIQAIRQAIKEERS